MCDFGSDFDPVSTDRSALEPIARAQEFLDVLAAGQQVGELDDSGDEALAALLVDWRDELRWPPATGLVSESEAVTALRDGVTNYRQTRRRTRRVLAVVGSVAATALSLGGFAAVVAQTHPGDPLYNLHTMMFGEPASVHDDRIALAAKTELDNVAQMIDQGQWDQAQDRLITVSSSVQSVNDTNRRQDLVDQVNQLNAKVASRDPNATPAPGSSPGPLATTSPATQSPPGRSTTTTSRLFPAVPSSQVATSVPEGPPSSAAPAAIPSAPPPQAPPTTTAPISPPSRSPSAVTGAVPTTTAPSPSPGISTDNASPGDDAAARGAPDTATTSGPPSPALRPPTSGGG